MHNTLLKYELFWFKKQSSCFKICKIKFRLYCICFSPSVKTFTLLSTLISYRQKKITLKPSKKCRTIAARLLEWVIVAINFDFCFFFFYRRKYSWPSAFVFIYVSFLFSLQHMAHPASGSAGGFFLLRPSLALLLKGTRVSSSALCLFIIGYRIKVKI